MSSSLTCKQILLVGEGSFLYTDSLVFKYKNDLAELPKALTSTELNNNPSKETISRIDQLKKIGVKIILGVDATELHTNSDLKNKRFKRIMWVCPHAGGSYVGPNNTEGKTSKALALFFFSASHLQKSGDQIRVVLAQGDRKEWRQSKAYGIVKASQSAGYALVQKRDFGPKRYPGYEHRQNGKSIAAKAAVNRSVEYIFQKRINIETVNKAMSLFGSIPFGNEVTEVRIINIILSLLELDFSDAPLSDGSIDSLSLVESNLDKLAEESQVLLDDPNSVKNANAIKKVAGKVKKMFKVPSEISPKKLRGLEFFPSPQKNYRKLDEISGSLEEYLDSDSEIEPDSDTEMTNVENS